MRYTHDWQVRMSEFSVSMKQLEGLSNPGIHIFVMDSQESSKDQIEEQKYFIDKDSGTLVVAATLYTE